MHLYIVAAYTFLLILVDYSAQFNYARAFLWFACK